MPAGQTTAVDRPTSASVAPWMAVSSEKILRCTAIETLGDMESWRRHPART